MANRTIVPCPKGLSDPLGNCWNIKLELKMVRGPDCHPGLTRWTKSLPGPLKEAWFRQVMAQDEVRAALEQIDERLRRDAKQRGK